MLGMLCGLKIRGLIALQELDGAKAKTSIRPRLENQQTVEISCRISGKQQLALRLDVMQLDVDKFHVDWLILNAALTEKSVKLEIAVLAHNLAVELALLLTNAVGQVSFRKIVSSIWACWLTKKQTTIHDRTQRWLSTSRLLAAACRSDR